MYLAIRADVQHHKCLRSLLVCVCVGGVLGVCAGVTDCKHYSEFLVNGMMGLHNSGIVNPYGFFIFFFPDAFNKPPSRIDSGVEWF